MRGLDPPIQLTRKLFDSIASVAVLDQSLDQRIKPANGEIGESEMKWYRNALLLIASLGCSTAAIAETLIWPEAINGYLQVALSPQQTVVRKFNRVTFMPAKLECGDISSVDCENAKQAFKDSIAPSFNLSFDLQSAPDIEFVFGSPQNIKDLGEKDLSDGASHESQSQFSDASDPECQVYYSYVGATIQHAKVLVSMSQNPVKLKFCIASQTMQALGLSLYKHFNFDQLWKSELDGPVAITESTFPEWRHGYAAYEYVHMCPEVLPGQNEGQAIAALNSPTSCLSKLKGLR